MLVATWVLAGGTLLIGLTSLIAVLTWRENRRREREAQLVKRILDEAGKEITAATKGYAQKETVDNRTFLGFIAATVLGVVAWNLWNEGPRKQ